MRVINGKVEGFSKGVYVGRTMPGLKGSPLANPFKIGRDGSREQVIQRYRLWLWEQIKGGNAEVIAELKRIALEQADVVCWCSPLPCHGDVVIKAAKWVLENLP
jgi:hypothetical protein